MTRWACQMSRRSCHLTRWKAATFPLERPIPTYHSYLPKCLKPGQGVHARAGLAGGPGGGLKLGRVHES